MKKIINSIILAVISIVFFSYFFGSLKAHAAGQDYINIYSNIYNASAVINAEFEYEITPDAGNQLGVTGEPTTVLIQFNNVAPTNNLTTMVGKIDFSGANFPAAGVYKYIVREVASSNADYQVSSEKYEIYVMVTNTTVNVFQQAKDLATDLKGDINFNHAPDYTYVTISHETMGDNVDREQYFRFKVEIDSLCIGCEYDVLGQDEYVLYNGQRIRTSNKYTVQSSGVPNYIYLKNGQAVTIGLSGAGTNQIPVGTRIVISSDDDLNTRKWTMFVDDKETMVADFLLGGHIRIEILMERNMLVPNTGLFAEFWPFMILLVIGGCGLFAFLNFRKDFRKNSGKKRDVK